MAGGGSPSRGPGTPRGRPEDRVSAPRVQSPPSAVWPPDPFALPASGPRPAPPVNEQPVPDQVGGHETGDGLDDEAREEDVRRRRADEAGATLAYVNLVGGQDELVFDGGSFVANAEGKVVMRTAFFAEAQPVIELDGDDVLDSDEARAMAAELGLSVAGCLQRQHRTRRSSRPQPLRTVSRDPAMPW